MCVLFTMLCILLCYTAVLCIPEYGGLNPFTVLYNYYSSLTDTDSNVSHGLFQYLLSNTSGRSVST